ncbi:hypothetical protein [Streptomyces sp. NPDC047718]|uniref:hypothetical protein n=1 Tax=Streptomyces sp. NPDC047718 TaxID=3155479 RepID=UPI0033EDA9B9
MKLLTPGDVRALGGLLRQRMDWMAARNLPLTAESSHLMDFVLQPDRSQGWLPVGMWDGDGDTLLAAFAMRDAAPADGWTLEERVQPTRQVSLAHTLPGEQQLSCLLTRWVCDHAARKPNPPSWVRCTVRRPRLATYLEADGWAKVREVAGVASVVSHLFQRPPQRNEIVHYLARGKGELVAC